MSAPHSSHGKSTSFSEAARIIAKRKWSFLFFFTLVYFVSFSVLALVDIVPSGFAFAPRTSPPPLVLPGSDIAVSEGELPVRIEIPQIDLKANVSNPNSTTIATLDAELLRGAVRYPGSGVPGEKGNVLIFGHSSYLPVVHNQAYKAFNGIQNLVKGDQIYIYGESEVYTYAVDTVREENTATGEIVLATDGAHLTLATCDTFGAKSDRFIVTATLVRVEAVTE